jgi:RecJ-like exonuclease
MRWLAVFAVMIVGCVATLPLDDVGLTADLATQTAYELGKAKPVQPEGDVCKNCNGTGKIGDGRIVNVCPECKGTGKR